MHKQTNIQAMMSIVVTLLMLMSVPFVVMASPVEKISIMSGSKDIVVTANQTKTINMTLEKSGVLSGTITNDAGQPVSSVKVIVYSSVVSNSQIGAATTNFDGRYIIRRLDSGTYRLKFVPPSGENYAPAYYDNVANWEQAKEIKVTANQTTTVNATLTRGGAIVGKLTNKAGKPFNHVRIDLYSSKNSQDRIAYTSTDAEGNYVIDGLATNRYRLKFNPGFHMDYQNYADVYYDNVIDWEQAKDIAVTMGQTTTINATLAKWAVISGTVTDAAGKPLDNVYVEAKRAVGGVCGEPKVWQKAEYIRSDEQGHYLIDRLKPDTYRVEFSLNGYVTKYYDDVTEIAEAKDIPLKFDDVRADVNAVLTEFPSKITGKVTNKAGTPLKRARVQAYKDNGNGIFSSKDDTYTDANGVYTLRLSTGAGRYKVQFDDWAWDDIYPIQYYNRQPSLSEADPIEVALDQIVTGIDAVLEKDATITGKVTTEAGVGLKRGSVNAYQYNPINKSWDILYSTRVNDNSVYTLSLSAGQYKVSFGNEGLDKFYNKKPNKETADIITLAKGETKAGIDLILADRSRISSRTQEGSIRGQVAVADADVLPCLRAYAYGYNPNTKQWNRAGSTSSFEKVVSTSRQDAVYGKYEISQLAPGTYRLEFEDTSNRYKTIYYDNKPSLETATDITVTANQPTSNIDGQFNGGDSANSYLPVVVK